MLYDSSSLISFFLIYIYMHHDIVFSWVDHGVYCGHVDVGKDSPKMRYFVKRGFFGLCIQGQSYSNSF